MVLPRTVPLAKPGAGSPNATISLPDWSTGGAVVRAEAAGTQTSAATARTGRRRFTRKPSCGLEPGNRSKSTAVPPASLIGEGGGRQLLEVPDQLLAVAHEDAVLEGARGDAALYALDEGAVLEA